MKQLIAAVSLVAASACTSLGPMPATTAISAVPEGRTGVEVQGAVVPGFMLSDSATQTQKGESLGQLSVLFEAGKSLLARAPGLLVGVRRFDNGGGASGDAPIEPFVGYRGHVTDGISLAVVGYGTEAAASDDGASYSAFRLGAELSADVRIFEIAHWVSMHAQLSAAATDISAHGTYCVDPSTGIGEDCGNDVTPRTGDTPTTTAGDTRVTAQLDGVFPSGTAQLSLDVGHRPSGYFHDARLAVMTSVGQMPMLDYGREVSRAAYASWGISLTLGFGAAH